MAINPVEMISASRQRIARVAAIRASIYFLAPALTAIVLGAIIPVIGAMTWERMGYLLDSWIMFDARLALFSAGVIAILVGAYRGWRAYSIEDDFVGAAIRVDARLHANEQVVTLATLSNPDLPASTDTQPARSPLFPVLWRNVSAVLGSFNPEKEFPVEVGGPIKKSSLPSAAIAVVLGIATLALIRPPSPIENTAIQLRKLADKMEASATTPEEKQIAQKIKRVANDLTNPKVPPEEKKKEIDEVLAQVEKKEASAGDEAGAASGGKGSGAGNSSASAGGSEGKGAGGQSQGQGKGSGKGEGKGGSGQNAQNNAGNKNGKKNDSNGTADSIELKNELAKAQAQVQTDDLASNQTPNKPAPEAKTAQAPQPGNNPNQQGGSSKNPNEKGSAPVPVPQAGNNAGNQMPNGKGNKPKGGTGGDTHLGEFPTAANYERFLKPGDKGGLHLNDARYVVFKIPAGPTSGDGGKTVIDTERSKAITAYTNAPLAPTADTAPPDERQLVPPRYRDLIH